MRLHTESNTPGEIEEEFRRITPGFDAWLESVGQTPLASFEKKMVLTFLIWLAAGRPAAGPIPRETSLARK